MMNVHGDWDVFLRGVLAFRGGHCEARSAEQPEYVLVVRDSQAPWGGGEGEVLQLVLGGDGWMKRIKVVI